MIDEQDFSLDVEDSAPTAGPAASPPPRVVIEYRNRGFPRLLIPPILILLSVLVILSSRRGTPILAPTPTPVVAQSEPPAQSGPASPTPTPVPAAVGSEPEPAPLLPLAVASALPSLPDLDELMPSPTVKTRAPGGRLEDAPSPPVETRGEPPGAGATGDDGPGPDPAPAPVGKVNKIDRPLLLEEPPPPPVAVSPPPEVSKEQVLQDIRDEAARKAAEIRKLEELKPQARLLEVNRMIKKAEANRAPFHIALREQVKSKRRGTGQAIEALCNEYGRDTSPEVRAQISRLLAKTYARSTLKVKVEMMRAWGAPETIILDYIANSVDRSLGTPGGPRDGDEVRIRAARILLGMPPATAAARSDADSAPAPGSTPGPRPH